MSYSVDVNLLLYGSDQASPHFEAAQEFLRRKLSDPEIFYLAWPTAMGYLRMSTHSRIFAVPLTPSEALSNLQNLVAHPRVRTLSEKDGFLTAYAEVTSAFPVRANLVPAPTWRRSSGSMAWGRSTPATRTSRSSSSSKPSTHSLTDAMTALSRSKC